MKLSQALTGYWLDKQLTLSKTTIKNYSEVFKLLIEFTKDKDIDKLTSTDIKQFLSYLSTERNNSNRTVNTRYLILCSLFSWATTELDLSNPMKKVQKPKFTANKVKPFTKVEIKQLLSAKQSSTLKALQLVLLDTGLRISEALSLQVKDYDVKNGRLYVRSGKGNKDRIVYLGQKTQKVLWKLCSDRTEGFVFKTRNATQINRMNFVRTLHKIAKPLQIKAHPHKYRHTFAVNFLRNGGNIKQLQEILGHSNLDTVNIYLQLAEVDLEQSRTYSPVDNL